MFRILLFIFAVLLSSCVERLSENYNICLVDSVTKIADKNQYSAAGAVSGAMKALWSNASIGGSAVISGNKIYPVTAIFGGGVGYAYDQYKQGNGKYKYELSCQPKERNIEVIQSERKIYQVGSKVKLYRLHADKLMIFDYHSNYSHYIY